MSLSSTCLLYTSAVHTFNFPRFLAVMRRRALYINGGGSLIQDVTSRRSLWYYLFTLRAAKRLGCKVMMYGCGIGPVKRPGGVERTRRVLNSCVDAITLREPDSIEAVSYTHLPAADEMYNFQCQAPCYSCVRRGNIVEWPCKYISLL